MELLYRAPRLRNNNCIRSSYSHNQRDKIENEPSSLHYFLNRKMNIFKSVCIARWMFKSGLKELKSTACADGSITVNTMMILKPYLTAMKSAVLRG